MFSYSYMFNRYYTVTSVMFQYSFATNSAAQLWIERRLLVRKKLSEAADEGCTSKTLRTAAAQHGKADSSCRNT